MENRHFYLTLPTPQIDDTMLPGKHHIGPLMTHPRIPTLPDEVLANIRAQKDRAPEAPKPEDDIHIVLAIDEGYAPHAAVTIASALDHTGHPDALRFHILEDGTLCEPTRTKLRHTARDRLSFTTVRTDDLTDLPLNRNYISQATYYRLAMHTALPRDVSRIIYIDADTVVTDALEYLWAIPLDGCAIGACADEGGLTQSARLGLPTEHLYFNAGVSIFDLDALRGMDFAAAVAETYARHKEKITLQDQDLLNLVFCGKTKALPLRWNVGTRLYLPSEVEAAYSQDEALAAASAPGILHFTDRRKPWTVKDLNPMGHLYWSYRNQTPWRETWPQTALRRTQKILRHMFSRSQREINAQIRTLEREKG